jgi:hypothetical protein
MDSPTTDGQVLGYQAVTPPDTTPRLDYVNGIQTDGQTHAMTAAALSILTERVVYGVYNDAVPRRVKTRWAASRAVQEGVMGRRGDHGLKNPKSRRRVGNPFCCVGRVKRGPQPRAGIQPRPKTGLQGWRPGGGRTGRGLQPGRTISSRKMGYKKGGVKRRRGAGPPAARFPRRARSAILTAAPDPVAPLTQRLC